MHDTLSGAKISLSLIFLNLVTGLAKPKGFRFACLTGLAKP